MDVAVLVAGDQVILMPGHCRDRGRVRWDVVDLVAPEVPACQLTILKPSDQLVIWQDLKTVDGSCQGLLVDERKLLASGRRNRPCLDKLVSSCREQDVLAIEVAVLESSDLATVGVRMRDVKVLRHHLEAEVLLQAKEDVVGQLVGGEAGAADALDLERVLSRQLR